MRYELNRNLYTIKRDRSQDLNLKLHLFWIFVFVLLSLLSFENSFETANYRNQASFWNVTVNICVCVFVCECVCCYDVETTHCSSGMMLYQRNSEMVEETRPFVQHSWDQTGFKTLSKSIGLNFSDVSRLSLTPSSQKSLPPFRLSLRKGKNKSFAVFLHHPLPPPFGGQRRGGFTPTCLPTTRSDAAALLWFSRTSLNTAETCQCFSKWSRVSLRLVFPIQWWRLVLKKTSA